MLFGFVAPFHAGLNTARQAGLYHFPFQFVGKAAGPTRFLQHAVKNRSFSGTARHASLCPAWRISIQGMKTINNNAKVLQQCG
jgi:hypothetical protein